MILQKKYSHKIKNYQHGFTLFELMIAIAIVAILTAIGLPAYQIYIQKAAMTDMLQSSMPYKTAVEFCAFEKGNFNNCNNNQHGIFNSKETKYISSIEVNNGVIHIKGQNNLDGLTVELIPKNDATNNQIKWQKDCKTNPHNQSLEQACNDLFKF